MTSFNNNGSSSLSSSKDVGFRLNHINCCMLCVFSISIFLFSSPYYYSMSKFFITYLI